MSQEVQEALNKEREHERMSTGIARFGNWLLNNVGANNTGCRYYHSNARSMSTCLVCFGYITKILLTSVQSSMPFVQVGVVVDEPKVHY